MPEAPELATSRDQLRQMLLGKRFRAIDLSKNGRFGKRPPENVDQFREFLTTASPTIDSIDVKGKFMWWSIGPWKMWCTYGMSGQWTAMKNDSHVAAIVWCDSQDGSGLFSLKFRDPRHFGTIKFVNSPVQHTKKLASLGPDILNDPPTLDVFVARFLKKNDRRIAEAMMDQSCVSGIGNYLRAEILYDAMVDPWRCVSDISSSEYKRLYDSTLCITKSAYESQGASIKTYRDVNNEKGSAQFIFKVYGKSVDPLGNKVCRREDVNGRMMHWCPEVQK